MEIQFSSVWRLMKSIFHFFYQYLIKIIFSTKGQIETHHTRTLNFLLVIVFFPLIFATQYCDITSYTQFMIFSWIFDDLFFFIPYLFSQLFSKNWLKYLPFSRIILLNWLGSIFSPLFLTRMLENLQYNRISNTSLYTCTLWLYRKN